MSEKDKSGSAGTGKWGKAFFLLGWIALCVVFALAALTFFTWRWTGDGWWLWSGKSGQEVSPFEVLKTALTLVGGIGAVGYLVIKFKERTAAERQEDIEERERQAKSMDRDRQILAEAVSQLGSSAASTRIAGVYALEAWAAQHPQQRQKVINILCGYLRTSRLATDSDDNIRYHKGKDGNPDTTRPIDPDAAVESTILSMIGRHLRKQQTNDQGQVSVRQEVEDHELWCDYMFDLHGATLTENLNLNSATINGKMNFKGATINENAFMDFIDATLSGNVIFMDATINGTVLFVGATVNGTVNFASAAINGSVDFMGATTINGNMNFKGAAISGIVNFMDTTTISGNVNFVSATIIEGGIVAFEGATIIEGAFVDFGDANINGSAWVLFNSVWFVGVYDSETKNWRRADDPQHDFGSIPLEESTGLPEGARWVTAEQLEEMQKNKQ